MSRYANPVVRGNAPDPSVIRVGEDFFLATSTFDHLPGVRIRHSTDLVHWTIVGAAVTRPAQYRRDGRPGPVMLYAPTLRHHRGRFYVVCTNFADEQGNFVVSTDDPTGEWSDAAWIDTEAFDPSLLFAEGTCYYTRRTLAPRADGNLGPVVQAEIDPDTGALLGPMRELTPDYGGWCSNDIEGPHLYRIGDWYYLFSAEGSTWKGHMQTCARSRSPWGPFEPCPHNPVLTHRNRVGHPIQTVGHAELVDAPDGSWWALTHGTRHLSRGGFGYHHNLGRETFLAPVTWVDGWPVIGDGGRIELEMQVETPLPAAASTVSAPRTLWTEGWSSIGAAPPGVRGGGGDLELPFGRGIDENGAHEGVGAVITAQTEDGARLTATVVEPGPEPTGVAVYADAEHHYRLTVVAAEAGRLVRLRRQADDLIAESELALEGDGPVRLEIVADPERYAFLADGKQVGSGSARLLSAETCEAFVGVQFALIAEGSAGTARFSDIALTQG